jgi:cytochrome c oxidase assembly protein subunit 15
MTTTTQKKFQKWVLFLLFYTLIVILWGAWVRISHSGDGCGDSWPLCDGQVIPAERDGKTWIEFGHRLKSGLFGFVVLGLFLWGRRIFPPQTKARKYGFLTLAFTISEALLGAKLVLFGLVTDNDSPARALVMAAHMLNSMMLVASITLWWEASALVDWKWKLNHEFQQLRFSLKKFAVSGTLLFTAIAVSGSIAALSSTLFPSESLLQGLLDELKPDAHYLIRLRGLHPILGTVLGLGFALTAWMIAQQTKDSLLKIRSLKLTMLLVTGVIFGMLTLFLLYPVWMKLTHLLLAHLIWIHLVLWLRALALSPTTLERLP